MLEGLVLAVDVGKEVFSSLGQVQNGLKIDDFGTGFGYRREGVGKQLQIAHVLFNVIVSLHTIADYKVVNP